MNDASSNRAQCHNINNIYSQAKLQPGLLIPVIKANGSSVLISASPEPTGSVWKLYVFSFSVCFVFVLFFLATSWGEGDQADPHTLPGSREESGATAGAAAFAQSCWSREMQECSSLLHIIAQRQIAAPAYSQNYQKYSKRHDQVLILFWKNPSLGATASSSPSLIPEGVLPPGGSRFPQEGFWCPLHHFGPS